MLGEYLFLFLIDRFIDPSRGHGVTGRVLRLSKVLWVKEGCSPGPAGSPLLAQGYFCTGAEPRTRLLPSAFKPSKGNSKGRVELSEGINR